MEKNWLIRTKNNHILGPVSKKKIRDLIENGTIKGDDEVCSGNGYWIFVREKDLVQKYIVGDFPQDFNPVSEANSVLNSNTEKFEENDVHLPTNADLEYPDFDDIDDITQISGINISDLKVEEISAAPSAEVIQENASVIDIPPPKISQKKTKSNSKSKVLIKDRRDPSRMKQRKNRLSSNVLFGMAIAFFIVALVAFYYRKMIVSNFIETYNQVNFISPVYAQIKDGVSEKKN